MKLSDIFQIIYPKTLIYSDMVPDKDGINFVSSQEKNNGIVGRVQVVDGTKIYPAGCITVPLKGSVLMAHLQPQQCYVAHQIAVLLPKNSMSLQEKLYYITLIRHNSYKYNYGRQADKTLGDIFIPDACKYNVARIKSLRYNVLTTRNKCEQYPLNIDSWQEFLASNIFEIYNGKFITKEEIDENPGDFCAVQSGEENNGVLGKIDKQYCIDKGYIYTDQPCLTVARSGSAGYVSYQNFGCVVGDSAKILLLKDSSWRTPYIYLFFKTLLMANKFKYTYGRKVTEDKYLNEIIKLPVKLTKEGNIMIDTNKKYSAKGFVPDFEFMENYIKSLPYGDRI